MATNQTPICDLTTCPRCDGLMCKGSKLCMECSHEIRIGYLPTPEEIEVRAAEIRKEWSNHEHRRRAGVTTDPIEYKNYPSKKLFQRSENGGYE